ncbi:coxsackievirus and adenovirus receptor homolog [Anabas testudineus]|uniref:coxsackievirus and adenovirus receptor homolog n=1 Tax=Anabas testudineus TaxID=64144 RepID=UPI000E4656C5|nr:coxsackievirus and adenovirus receptor homolog [Anabas testudineus]XP_026225274.1 coxsackievirus and adenovirus receptor homolog [Anabas testudineus]
MYSLVVIVFITLISASFQELNKVKVKTGENVILQCDGPKDVQITLLEWIRPDLNSDGYVFFYRDERLYENYLHPSFVGRVELMDPKMKNGDVSVILRNVTDTDTGTYNCYVSVSKASRRQRATPDFSKTIELLVDDSGDGAGHMGGIKDIRGHGAAAVVPFIGVVALTLGVFLKRKRNNLLISTDEECQQP